LIPALEGSGYLVLSAEDTNQGMIHVDSGGIDVIVVDSCDCAPGSQLADFLSALAGLPEAPPFVLISESPSAPSDSARLGAAAFVPKPCATDDLDLVLTRMARTPQSASL